jgi:hypothetical protein
MAKEPSERFETIVDFASALAAAAVAAPSPPEPTTNTTLRLTSDPGVLSALAQVGHVEPSERAASGLREKAAVNAAMPTLPGTPSLSRLQRSLERAKKARSARDLDQAAKFVEHALAIADVLSNPSAAAAIDAEEALIEGALEMRLGRRDKPLRVALSDSGPGTSHPLLPEEAFLLSRIDGLASAEEVIDLSPLPRMRTLRLLVRLLRRDLILNA